MAQAIKQPIHPWAKRLYQAGRWAGNTVLWLLLWLSCIASMFLMIRYFSAAEWLSNLQGTPHMLAEFGMRLLMALPCTLLLVLLLRPVRTRRWIIGQLIKLAQRLRRKPISQPSEQPATPIANEIAPASPRFAAKPLTRRRFLIESGLVGGVVGYAMLIEPYQIQVREVNLPIANLPERFRGMRIAQMSDLHINAYTTSADLARAVAQINQLNPDMVLLTGDFVDWDARFADAATEPFRQLRAPEGIYSVLGNHDYYSGKIDTIKQAIQRHDLGLLVNQHTVLRRGADQLVLVGFDDPRHNRNGGPRLSPESINPEAALKGTPKNVARLAMVHNPVIVPHFVANYQLDVILSGHTHGGQFQVPILTDQLVGNAEYFVRGHYDLGKSQVYVNSGFGFTGPPLRFRAAPEITLINLVNAKA
ncbi:metallophosphoesterase [Herpetosiphon geysericola]|uniref:metallophosphoesterase n=1 Tax=Herpetosiphon geysericola TaxID=70996 RepID=UPI0006C91B06|nr:metallophosphoesterase [Herpetosiphon geysericola]